MPSTTNQSAKNISQGLPAVKGIAILMVVIYHIWGYSQGWLKVGDISWGNNIKGMLEGLLNVACLMGEQGVHLFLVASGFGLTASWWRQQAINAQPSPIAVIPFWRRRLSRIFPLYWAAHGLALLLSLINPTWSPLSERLFQGDLSAIAALIASLTTLRNFWLEYYFFLNPAWWYVGLAVQLYLVFPYLVQWGQRRGWATLLISSLLVSFSYRALVMALPLEPQAMDVLVRGAFFPSRLFEFVFGMVLAIAVCETPALLDKEKFANVLSASRNVVCQKRWIGLNLLLWSVGLACHWAASAGWTPFRIPADALIGVGEFTVIFQVVSGLPWLQSSLSFLGNASYGIYLTHMNLLRGLWFFLLTPLSSYWVRLGVVALICCGLGILFEMLFNQINNRWNRWYSKKLSN